MSEVPVSSDAADRGPWPAAVPLLAPYVVMIVLTAVADFLPDARALVYAAKVLVVCALLWALRRHYGLLRPQASGVLPAVVIGAGLIVLWVALDPWYPQSGAEFKQLLQTGWHPFPHGDKVTGQFNPFAPGMGLPPPVALTFRVLGAVVMTPLAEELFHRGWLLRFLVKEDYRQVPVGTFTWGSFLASCALFGFTHHEWLAGLLCGAALNGLLYWRRSLWLCVVCHAAANLALAGWVLHRGAWQFW